MFVFFSGCFKVTVGVLRGGRDDRTIAEDDKQKLGSTDLQLRGRKYVEMLDSDTKTNQRPSMFEEDVAETRVFLNHCAT